MGHTNEHNILDKHQFGFRTNSRTDNAIFKMISEILSSLNHGLLVDGIFCNLQKAFDCVSHRILLSKLKYYGITGKHYELYRSYMDGRHHRTSLSSACNNNNKLLSG